jgi:hypothetical protein
MEALKLEEDDQKRRKALKKLKVELETQGGEKMSVEIADV